MRLNDKEVMGIIQAIDPFINNIPVDLRLYGSRVDDSKKGGDIDLLLIVPFAEKDSLQIAKHKILAQIKKNIGERKIDLLICDPGAIESDPFVSLIFPSSRTLKEWNEIRPF
jgi:predicted nucleotidyltransferase